MNLLNQNDNQTTCTSARLTVVPRYQVRETDGAYVVTAQVPGVERSAIETTVHGETLTVVAKRTQAIPTDWTPIHRESNDADFRLTLELDHRVNRAGVTAELTHGVLTLTVPKSEAAKPRRIEVQG